MRRLCLQILSSIKKAAVLIVFCIVSFAATANAQFILYHDIAETGTPNLTPYFIKYKLCYNAAQGKNNCKPYVNHINSYAKAALANPTIPVNLDVEIEWPRYDTPAFTDSLNNYIAILNDFKTIDNRSPLSFYGVPPKQAYASFKSVNETFAPTALAMKPLADAVDYYSPDFYSYGSKDTTSWRKYADTTLAVIKKYYNAKPVYPYISPDVGARGAWAEIDSATWMFELNYLYKHTNGAIVWTGSKPKWNEDASWWIGTKKFLVQKGLAPPLVFYSFAVTGSPSVGTQLKWITSTDIISRYFVVQRSTDNVSFTNIGGHINKTGDSYHLNTYTYTDNYIPAGRKIYYRLAITDVYNKISYSGVLALKPG